MVIIYSMIVVSLDGTCTTERIWLSVALLYYTIILFFINTPSLSCKIKENGLSLRITPKQFSLLQMVLSERNSIIRDSP